ncbi:MAG: hypothetical protein LBE78_08620 [Burkholderiaceae bacterium]|jgi:hypothetical protein|nr:hypothetical protein [Burkholderiaceae bacterium]
MSDANAFNLGHFIPGFDFLQKLVSAPSGSGVPAPGLSGWVAPTVNVDELDRRIKDLKAVQFWLEQNAVAIKATVQALEVQKMTLATLQSMNLNMAEVAKAFTLPTAATNNAAAAPEPTWPYTAAPAKPTVEAPLPAELPADSLADPPARAKPARKRKPMVKTATRKHAGAGPAADPMQWWSALTRQFQHIAANALRETGSHAATVPAQSAASSPTADVNQAGAQTIARTGKPTAGKKTPLKKAAGKSDRKLAGKTPPKKAA